MHGQADGETGIDNGIAGSPLTASARGFSGATCSVSFGARGPTKSWKGWRGDEPPYHTPVYVLTHHPRPPLRMAGGTEFRFVTDGIHSAFEQAKAAAGSLDVRIGGGVATIRQYLRAGLIDDLRLVVRPVLLGQGEHLLGGIDVRALGYECEKHVAGERAMHVFLRKR